MSALRRFALLGDPVSHSVSPFLYSVAFEWLGIDARYEAVRVPSGEPQKIDGAMRDLAAAGGGNVTLPHKGAAAAVLELRMGAVEATGACNCFWFDDEGRLVGDNTDVRGFLAACADFAAGELRGADVLLLGAGGAARAVAVACAEAGVASLEIRNRTESRAERLVAELDLGGLACVQQASRGLERPYDMVVNATRLGLEPGDPLPVELDPVLCAAAFDLVYAPGGTSWTRHAVELGIPAQDGRTMLVHQAVYSLERWGVVAGGRDRLVRRLLDAAWSALDGRGVTDAGLREREEPEAG